MFTIKVTVRWESDQPEGWTRRESSGSAAQSSPETSLPTADDGIRDAKGSGMLPSGKK